MDPVSLSYLILSVLLGISGNPRQATSMSPSQNRIAPAQRTLTPVDCNCMITQGGVSYPISALQGNESAASFYDYGNPSGSSANTGLELNNGLIIFLYEDLNTSLISFFMIADIVNSGTGGQMEFEINCLPPSAAIVVQDDPGEFTGGPPLITGSWNWTSCCTDGGAIENIGCNNTFSVDLLVSSGIDSIVWLTGDIADPDQILLSLSGEVITISCGGTGVCCPIGFDTEVMVTDATCNDTPNGSVTLSPQDGVPAYIYAWSSGHSTQTVTGLLPGNYTVTITDSQGCMEELSINVGVAPGDPLAVATSMTICSETATGTFNLTSINSVVNAGTANAVLWFMNANMTGPIANPSSYMTGTTTVYAAVDNGSCVSDPVEVELIVIIKPIAMPAAMTMCEEMNGMTTFDLTSIDPTVSNGAGSVSWYLDPGLSNPIADPTMFFSGSTTIYAVVNDGTCLSDPVEIQLNVDLKPVGNTAEMHLCGDAFDDAIFDLTLLETQIGGGTVTIEWYEDIDLAVVINNPTQYQSTTATVYAQLYDEICYSDPIPVMLVVDHTPDALPVTAEQCDDGTSMATFNLWDYAMQVSNGVGGVNWFYDMTLLDQIPMPEAFYTTTITIYAIVDDGVCVSDPAAVQLNVIQSPVGNPTFLETCANANGLGTFNLTLANNAVSGGAGTVTWFEDAQGNIEITDPVNFESGSVVVYALISNGACASGFTPVNLNIINSVQANPVDFTMCDDGSGSAEFILSQIAPLVSGGSGQVNWFWDPLGTMPITIDTLNSAGSTLSASVTAGVCVSDTVTVHLIPVPAPIANDVLISRCGDVNGEANIDLTGYDMFVGGMDSVTWYGDPGLNTIISPPMIFTGDTVIYAIADNGNCTSNPATITIDITPALIATADTLSLCLPSGDTVLVDLTESNDEISGGSGIVSWFSDPAGTLPIASPQMFPVDGSIIVFANVMVNNCSSGIIPVSILATEIPDGNPIAIKKCGDTGGQVTIDLTASDGTISGNIGIVTWYGDASLSSNIPDATNFTSGDTTVYAVIKNGDCLSPTIPVTIEVVDSLVANAITIAECTPGLPQATIDLTASDLEISEGNGTVYWFYDPLATDTLLNPMAFTTGSTTVYAIVAADGCTSNVAAITIDVAASQFDLPECLFTSIDSVAASWVSSTTNYLLSYSINAVPVGGPMMTNATLYGFGGLGQGDTVEISVTALFDPPCMPITNTITCVTDVCPTQSGSFIGLQSAYCSDDAAILLDAIPAGGIFSGEGISGNQFLPDQVNGGNTVIQYTWTDPATFCSYEISQPVEIYDPVVAPTVECKGNSIHTVTFSLSDPGTSPYGYTISINQGAPSTVSTTITDTLLIDNLEEGDDVTLSIWSIGTPLCGNSDTIVVTCSSYQCPAAVLYFDSPGPLCSDGDPIQLMYHLSAPVGNPVVTWSGAGIIDPSGIFDPTSVPIGSSPISVVVTVGECEYIINANIAVIELPNPSFETDSPICADSVLHVMLTGSGYATADWNWDLGGATLVSGMMPQDFYLQWDEPGDYQVSLQINWLTCTTDTFVVPVHIDAPIDTPMIQCLEEEYYTISVGWEPVAGATSYTVSSSLGTGSLNGTNYIVRQLPDDTTVTITVIANTTSACGNTMAQIACHTIKYIPPVVFVPNIFSPNHDGLNDILYVQANEKIAQVNVFRIYDRWGGVVFSDTDFLPGEPAHGWDGTRSGKVLNPGVFVYQLEVLTVDEEVVVYKGDVTLVK